MEKERTENCIRKMVNWIVININYSDFDIYTKLNFMHIQKRLPFRGSELFE